MTLQTKEALESLHNTIVFDSRDWSQDARSAWVYGIIVGWSDEAYKELEAFFDYFDVARNKAMRLSYTRLTEALENVTTEGAGTVPLEMFWASDAGQEILRRMNAEAQEGRIEIHQADSDGNLHKSEYQPDKQESDADVDAEVFIDALRKGNEKLNADRDKLERENERLDKAFLKATLGEGMAKRENERLEGRLNASNTSNDALREQVKVLEAECEKRKQLYSEAAANWTELNERVKVLTGALGSVHRLYSADDAAYQIADATLDELRPDAHEHDEMNRGNHETGSPHRPDASGGGAGRTDK